jgi:hypothetical protein
VHEFLEEVVALAQRLTQQGIVIRSRTSAWRHFGSWDIEASSGEAEDRIATAYRAGDESGTAILVVRIIRDGKDNTLEVRLARATATTFAGSEHALSKTFESRAEAMIAAEAAVLEQLARST